MPIRLIAGNLLSSAIVTSGAEVIDSLGNGDPGPQFAPRPEQAWTGFDIAPLPLALGPAPILDTPLDVDFGAGPGPISTFALVHHNITGVVVSLYGGNTFPPATLVASGDPLGADPYILNFAPTTFRYWRLVIPAMSVPLALGELVLGVPYVIQQNPILESAGRVVVGNVARDRTPSGVSRKTKKGAPRVRLSYVWNWMPTATDYAALAAAFAACDEGAKNLIVIDELGVSRWMEIVSADLSPVPIAGPNTPTPANTAALVLEEVIL